MIVYAKYNSSRKEEFKLATFIERSDSTLRVIKEACTEKAIPFLEQMIIYERTHATLSPLAKLVAVKKENEKRIAFEFINTPTLQSLIIQSLQHNNKEAFFSLLDQYKKIIDSLESAKMIPEHSFKEFFGSRIQKSQECLTAGILDLNFDNILIHEDGTYTVIDYEWNFPFAIPKKYIIFRALFYLYTAIQPYNPYTFLQLRDLLFQYDIHEEDIQNYLYTEHSFHAHVLKKALQIEHYQIELDHSFAGTSRIKMSSQHAHDQYILLQKKYEAEIQRLNTQTRHTTHEIQQAKKQNRALVKKVHSQDRRIIEMEASRFWKMRNRYIKLKDMLLRK